MMVHNFDNDFRFADSSDAHALVRRACHRLIPDCIGVARASEHDDRNGVDFWIATRRGRFGLDLKLRRKDFGAINGSGLECVVELDSHGTSGWLLKPSGAHLILFATADTHRVALFDAKHLRIAVMLNLARWMASGQAREINTKSERHERQWSSKAVIISADLLANAIDRLGDGDLSANDGGAA